MKSLAQFSCFVRLKSLERGAVTLKDSFSSCLITNEPRNPFPPVTKIFLFLRFTFGFSFEKEPFYAILDKLMNKVKPKILVILVVAVMLVYFLLATPVMMDDGEQYEGFAELLARGHLDFKSFYGFQGLSFFAVPIFWLTGSKMSIIIASIIFSLLSIPLAYLVGRDYYQSKRAALLFFILLIIHAGVCQKVWTPLAWAIGGIVKPFALVLLPLFAKNFLTPSVRKFVWVLAALMVGVLYLGVSYYQTGHLINNAAINSYQGNFDTGNPPPLVESFTVGVKGYLRVGANLLLSFRKIMVSPFIIVLGAISLLFNKGLTLRKEIILVIILNFLLVGSLSFSFSKYLLPMTTLLSLASVSYLLKYKWLMVLVFLDPFFVFLPIWNYFGYNFWSNIYVYLLPFMFAVVLFIYERLLAKHNFNPNP